jgi:hypothetical protein
VTGFGGYSWRGNTWTRAAREAGWRRPPYVPAWWRMRIARVFWDRWPAIGGRRGWWEWSYHSAEAGHRAVILYIRRAGVVLTW